MSNFSSFFAFGKRATFSLSHNGREIIGYDSGSYVDSTKLGLEFETLIQEIFDWFWSAFDDLTTEQRDIFEGLMSHHACREFDDEVYLELAEFVLKISRV